MHNDVAIRLVNILDFVLTLLRLGDGSFEVLDVLLHWELLNLLRLLRDMVLVIDFLDICLRQLLLRNVQRVSHKFHSVVLLLRSVDD